MKCRICGGAMERAFDALVLNAFTVNYFHCSNCGYICTEEPYWMSEAYASALAVTDTGAAMRNFRLACRLRAMLYFGFRDRGQLKWLDYGGGYGLLTRLMRDFGFDFHWYDKYAPNLVARGFEGQPESHFDGLTAIEVMEHTIDPFEFVSGIMTKTGAESLIFSTELYAGDTPPPKSWWYYAFVTGQHISLFSHKTLKVLAGRLGLDFYSHRSLHTFSRRKIGKFHYNFSTGWLAETLPNFAFRGVRSKTWTDYLTLSEALKKSAVGKLGETPSFPREK